MFTPAVEQVTDQRMSLGIMILMVKSMMTNLHSSLCNVFKLKVIKYDYRNYKVVSLMKIIIIITLILLITLWKSLYPTSSTYVGEYKLFCAGWYA